MVFGDNDSPPIHQSSCNEKSLSDLTKWLIKRIFIFVVIILLLLAIPVLAKTEENKNIVEVDNIVVTKIYPEHITEQKQYAYDKVLEKWGVEQWQYFDDLIQRESRWNNTAQNPKSTAFGYGQFLNSTWSLVGCEKTTDPDTQINCTISYIEKVYGTPQKAIAYHNANNYY